VPGYATDYWAGRVLDHSNNVNAYSPPATLWLALTTVVLTRTDVSMPTGVELVGFGYARVQFPNDATFWSPAAVNPETGVVESVNLVTVTFPNATADYPATSGWAILDDPIGGNVYHAGSFDDQLAVPANGGTPLVEIGVISIPVSGV
jgi:hypothetical protein